MQTQAQLILDKCNEVVAKARELYGLDLSKVQIRMDLRGRAAGVAMRRGGIYTVRFNRDMMTREAFDHVLNNTVPHEFAHIVCFMNPSLGKNHDYGWARVCERLGGNGKRTHREEVVYGKGATYEYTTDSGHKVRCSQQIHAKIQRGVTYTYRGKGKVTQLCAHSIVGVQGRTLQQPIIRRAANHPSVIEESLHAARPSQEEMARRAALVEQLRLVQKMVTPVQAPAAPVAARFNSGESKASVARAIVLSGYRSGQTAEKIVEAIMMANGHAKGMAVAYFKDSLKKLNITMNYV